MIKNIFKTLNSKVVVTVVLVASSAAIAGGIYTIKTPNTKAKNTTTFTAPHETAALSVSPDKNASSGENVFTTTNIEKENNTPKGESKSQGEIINNNNKVSAKKYATKNAQNTSIKVKVEKKDSALNKKLENQPKKAIINASDDKKKNDNLNNIEPSDVKDATAESTEDKNVLPKTEDNKNNASMDASSEDKTTSTSKDESEKTQSTTDSNKGVTTEDKKPILDEKNPTLDEKNPGVTSKSPVWKSALNTLESCITKGAEIARYTFDEGKKAYGDISESAGKVYDLSKNAYTTSKYVYENRKNLKEAARDFSGASDIVGLFNEESGEILEGIHPFVKDYKPTDSYLTVAKESANGVIKLAEVGVKDVLKLKNATTKKPVQSATNREKHSIIYPITNAFNSTVKFANNEVTKVNGLVTLSNTYVASKNAINNLSNAFWNFLSN